MQFQLGRELEEFRQEVRAFVNDHLPPDIAHRVRRQPNVHVEEDAMRWTRILHEERGWSVPHWPEEYGGRGWSPMQLFIFDSECHKGFTPMFPWQNSHMIGPLLYTFGTEEQKERFLPPMIRGDYHWAQGFSEPGSGSDLASLRTSAVRDGDDYVVNGQKIWTSGAHHCKWIFALVRTNTEVKPQLGISMLLIDLESPGVTIRPIPHIEHTSHLCEVFFDEVRVPADQMVGEEGTGWSYGKFLLDHERTASSFIYWSKREMEKVKLIAYSEKMNGVLVIENPAFRQKLARLEADLVALEWSVLRVLAKEVGEFSQTAIASTLKILGSDLQQRITALQFEALGLQGLRRFYTEEAWDFPGDDPLWPEHTIGTANVFLHTRCCTINGGTRQIQRNLIAKTAFQL